MAGLGLAYLPEDQVLRQLADGRLIRVLEDWYPPFVGYHLYYPSRPPPNTGVRSAAEALRYRADNRLQPPALLGHLVRAFSSISRCP
jgi:DNA-binding transcriptional LysR family regulator